MECCYCLLFYQWLAKQHDIARVVKLNNWSWGFKKWIYYVTKNRLLHFCCRNMSSCEIRHITFKIYFHLGDKFMIHYTSIPPTNEECELKEVKLSWNFVFGLLNNAEFVIMIKIKLNFEIQDSLSVTFKNFSPTNAWQFCKTSNTSVSWSHLSCKDTYNFKNKTKLAM